MYVQLTANQMCEMHAKRQAREVHYLLLFSGTARSDAANDTGRFPMPTEATPALSLRPSFSLSRSRR
jgi:hypothetical protein